MLFVPAHRATFVARAHERGADACILDLEDSVPAAEKENARRSLLTSAAQVTRSGAAALVRVNQPWELTELDLDAAVAPTVSAILLPKVNHPTHVHVVARAIDALEAQRAMSRGHTRLIALIEDVHALPRLDEIATSSPRLMGMILGSEDFSASVGMAPIPQALFAPNQLVLFACRRAGILPFGFPGSIADYADIEAFRQQIRLARQLGFVGAFCIHPAQVAVMNEEFTPPPAELEHAKALIAAYDAAVREGRGAIEYLGKMVDPPVVARAQELLRRARAIQRCAPH
jgi:citrate lyase subunit beta / citryl-CoA lyase